MTRAVSHVAFDFDGTLADSRAALLRLYNDLALRRGYGLLTPGNLDDLRGRTIPERCRALGVPTHHLPGLVMQIAQSYANALEDVSLYGDVTPLLHALRSAGYRLAVVSTNDEGNIRAVLRRHGVEDAFDRVTCSHRLFGKARLLKSVLRQDDVRPDALVYVGDEARDVEASRAVGVRVVGVTWGVDTLERLRSVAPDFLANRPDEIAGWLGAPW